MLNNSASLFRGLLVKAKDASVVQEIPSSGLSQERGQKPNTYLLCYIDVQCGHPKSSARLRPILNETWTIGHLSKTSPLWAIPP